jgi:hypothetical protein
MHSGKFVFSQVLEFVSKYEFEKCVKRYNGNRHIRELDCWNQFVQLLFGQLAGKPSLRSITVCLKAHEHQLYHLGIKRYVDFRYFHVPTNSVTGRFSLILAII